jgi:hypothetical protein
MGDVALCFFDAFLTSSTHEDTKIATRFIVSVCEGKPLDPNPKNNKNKGGNYER